MQERSSCLLLRIFDSLLAKTSFLQSLRLCKHLNRVQVAKFVQASKQSSSSYAFALHKQSLCKQAKTSFVQARTRSTLTLFGKVRSYRVLSFAFKFCCLPRPTLHKRRRVSLCSSSKTLRALGSQVQLRCTNFAPEQGSGCTDCARTRARFEQTHVSFALANHLRWHSKWLTRSNRVLGQELNRFLNPLSHNSDPLVGESSIRPSVSFSHGNSVQVNLNKVQTKAQAKGAKDRNPVPIFRSTKSKYQSTIPDFVKIQRKSFVLFLQKGFLDEVLKRYPLTNPKGDLELSFYPEYYKLARPDYSPQKSILKSKTYASKLYIPVQLTNKKNQKINVQWVLLGHLVRFV